MKLLRLILVCFSLLALQSPGHSQTDSPSSVDTILVNQNDTSTVEVSITNMNVLYRGIANPIQISIPNNVNKLVVECSCENFDGANGKYTIRPGAEKKIILTISQIEQGKVLRIQKFNFRVKSVPTPVITWANKQSSDTIIAKTASMSPLIPRMSDFDFDVYSIINSYDISYTYDNIIGGMTGIIGNSIPTNIAKEIANLPSGTPIFLNNVKLTVPGGEQRKSSVFFIVK